MKLVVFGIQVAAFLIDFLSTDRHGLEHGLTLFMEKTWLVARGAGEGGPVFAYGSAEVCAALRDFCSCPPARLVDFLSTDRHGLEHGLTLFMEKTWLVGGKNWVPDKGVLGSALRYEIFAFAPCAFGRFSLLSFLRRQESPFPY